MNDALVGDVFERDGLDDHLPVGVIVLDAASTIVHVNQRVLDLTGFDRCELVGRSALELIDGADARVIQTALQPGRGPGAVMGPVRLRYRLCDGETRSSEFWARHSHGMLGVEHGLIVTMTSESVTDYLTAAMYRIASDEPLDETLTAVAGAVRGSPLAAAGAIVLRRRGRLDAIGDWPFDDEVCGTSTLGDSRGPWDDVLSDGAPLDIDIDDVAEPLRSQMTAADCRALWARPVFDQRGAVAAAFLAWRRERGEPSANQERHLAEAVSAARLAIVHDEHRNELERAALTDHLTGVGNRAHLAQRLSGVEERRVAVLYVDLDGFKSVNDAHGHDVGDLVLRAAARRLQAIVRDSDDVFRIGGDEFVVLCAGASPDDREPLDRIAERIVSALHDPFRVGDVLIEIGASVGIAERIAGESTSDVIRRADHALLDAKRAGKHRWRHAASDTG